ncbi:mechanosensitive ion channel family protein [Novosphingobium sp.]|uniref:mechanosensitive ion channel family protein n=1 Tax=Novosphingobium sp. TaxID=1874826 RepID=UPI0038BD191D
MNRQLRDVARARREARDAIDSVSIDIGHYHISLLNALWMVFVVLCTFYGARLAARIGRIMVRRVSSLDPTQKVLTEKLVTLAVWALAFFTAIDVLGISLTALTVFSGAFGLAIGFGLQKTFGNMIAGIILLMDRSIKPGDVVAVSDGKGNTFGEVKKIGLRAVSVTTRDNREYLIPNEILMTSQVENWSYSSREVAISIPVGVAYGSDIDLAERLLLEAARSAPRVLQDPAPGVLLSAFGPSAIEMQVICWIDDPEMGVGNVRSEVLKAAWHLFRQQGVEIPFPQSDVHLRDSDGLRAVARILAERPATD